MPEVLESQTHFTGRIVRVRVDRVRLDDGVVVRQEVVEHAESVTVVVFQDPETVLLIRQYRHPAGQVLLETPAGSMDPGETPAEAAQRELAEEIGYRARTLLPAGRFDLAPGWATELMHAFVALDLEPAEGEKDQDERIELVPLPWARVWDMVRAGEVLDCKTIAALTLAEGVAPTHRS